jgi:uncharacterized lipoprotein YddW (UPF0748 family)
LSLLSALCSVGLSAATFAANPLVTLLQDFESGGTGGAVAVTTSNSSSGGASNTTVDNVTESGSKRLRLTDADGTYNGASITFTGAIPQAGYYLFTVDVKVDNASAAIGTFGMAVATGGPTTAKISDVNAGYVLNLAGTGDAALGYQTIGAAINVPAGGTFPQDLTIYFGTDPSGNSYNAPASDGNYNGTHRGAAATWAAGSTNAVYLDNIKRIGPGNFREERHLWISIGDGMTNLATLENLLVQAKNNNFNCVDLLGRYRANSFYVPNRYNTAYPSSEPYASGASATNDPIQYAIDRGRELGLKVFVSFGCFMVAEGATPYPAYMPSGSIMWYYNSGAPRAMTTSDPSAEGLWADVSRADVRQYTKNVLMDFVSNYDVDGIIFDRIRYPSYNYSYNPQGLAEMGISGTPSPTDSTFRNARRDAVTTFLNECYESVTTQKPWMIVGAAPIAYGDALTDTYNSVMQFWPKWSAKRTANRAISFGSCDLYQPQFYRLYTSNPAGPGANTTLMNKAQFGDTVSFSMDYGLMPGAMAAVAPLFYHPTSGDTNQSNCNAQNITDSRALAMDGFGFFSATPTLADISLIRAPGASTAGVDVLANAAVPNDYLFKADYDNVKPNPVTNFAASPQADGRVNLTWTPPAAAADGESAASYLIYRSTTSPVKEYRSNQVTYATVPGAANNYTVATGFAGTYYYRIVPVDDYNNRGTASQVGPITVTGEPTPPADIIVDNPQATLVGSWTLASSATDKYGADYRYKSPGTGTSTASFAATIPLTGTWAVSEWHPAGSNRATDARHTISHAGGSMAANVNQTVNGGKWNLVAQLSFNSGSPYSVTIDDQFTGTVIMADAIKWSYVVQAPAAPSGLAATPASQTQINVTWTDNSANERNFIVARSTTSGGPYTDIASPGVNVTSYSDTGLTANTTYYYVVRATNSAGTSANSAQAAGTTLPNPPTAPGGLAATAASQTQVNLTWVDNSSNETNFVVARSATSGGPYADIATLAANTTSYSNTGLTANTTYYYVVRATNSGGSSANSAQASATTLPNPPAAPGSLAATAVSSSQINLTWTDNSTNETNFVVARSTTSGGPYTDVVTLAANTTSYSNTGLTASTTYYYVVRATNTGGASANSNQASATTQASIPAAPGGLSATAASPTQINLSWTDNSSNETNFVVGRSTTSGGPYTDIATLAANTTSYSNTGLAVNTTYYYVVRATNAGGSSANSSQAGATTPLPDIIVDNPAATLSGAWTLATSATDKYGADYQFANSGSGATATFNANVPVAGNYQVQAWYPQGSNRANNAPYTVNFNGGSLTYSVNQQTGGGQWVTLGTHYFAAAGGQVVIGTTGANPSVVMADAVRFTYLNATAPVTVTYDSVAADDGYVLESSETSNVGGTINSTNTTFAVGDDSSRRQFKGVLSFDTSPIPDGATIQKVSLKLTQYSINGGDPWAVLGTLNIDIKSPNFGAAAALATDDFAAAAGAASVGTVAKPSGNNVTVTSAVNSTGVFLVSKTGKTQFRVQFTIDDDNDSVNDYVNFYSGDYSTNTTYRPKLEIEYTQ